MKGISLADSYVNSEINQSQFASKGDKGLHIPVLVYIFMKSFFFLATPRGTWDLSSLTGD